MNPFNILGVSCNSSIEACKVAYKNLCVKYHPDNGGDEAKFDEVNKAWSMIRDGFTMSSFGVNRSFLRHVSLFNFRKS